MCLIGQVVLEIHTEKTRVQSICHIFVAEDHLLIDTALLLYREVRGHTLDLCPLLGHHVLSQTSLGFIDLKAVGVQEVSDPDEHVVQSILIHVPVIADCHILSIISVNRKCGTVFTFLTKESTWIGVISIETVIIFPDGWEVVHI